MSRIATCGECGEELKGYARRGLCRKDYLRASRSDSLDDHPRRWRSNELIEEVDFLWQNDASIREIANGVGLSLDSIKRTFRRAKKRPPWVQTRTPLLIGATA